MTQIRRAPKRLLKIVIVVSACFILLYSVLRFSPYPELETYRNRSRGYILTDRNGYVLRAFPAGDGVKREQVPLHEIPPGVLQVFLRAEDRRFYTHPGVDPAAVISAVMKNLRSGRTVSGASTVTMQLARMIKPHERGTKGKIREAADALRLEARLSKKQILELWINGIPFGANTEGLSAAGRIYFGRELSGLDDARTVLLAVIPRRPGLYDPSKNPQIAVNAALDLSRRCKLNLSEEALWKAVEDASPETLAELKNPFHAPHFTDRAAAFINLTGNNHYKIRTTIDLDLQLYAERRLATEVKLMENNRVSNGAVLGIDNLTGEVLIYAGSVSWFDDENKGKIDGVRVRNQPGSCLKPFLYALALEKGFSPNDILPDIHTVFGSGRAYIPQNFNRRYNGPVRLRVALASSLNVPAVYILERLGVRTFEDYLAGLGFNSIAASKGSFGVGLALGNAEVSLEEMTGAFAVFPRGGRALNLSFVPDLTGQAQQQEIYSVQPHSAWIITDILSDKPSRFTGFGSARVFDTEFPSIFKTGTANQFQHIWALGANARFTVGVWMGNFTGETVIGRTGSSVPAFIAGDLLKAMEQAAGPDGGTFFHAPDGLHKIEICTVSGMIFSPRCSGSAVEWVQNEYLPDVCTWHRSTGELEYPPEYRSWIAERFRGGGIASPNDSTGVGRIRIPVSGSVFYFNPALPSEAQAVRVEAAGFSPGAPVYANGVLQGGLNHAGVFALPLRRGIYEITVEDDNISASTVIEVR